jgi:hypothetical protein
MAAINLSSMKILPFLLSVAAITGFIIVPIDFDTAVSLLFVAGLALVVICDYRREIRPLHAATVNARVTSRTERLGLAA